MSSIADVLCPDCGANFDLQRLMRHAPTCPLAAAEDECQSRDREFFKRHPEASEFRRPVDASELSMLRALAGAPTDWIAVGRTRVVRLSGAVRARDFSGVVFVPGEVAS
jgi:hypothetical protein